MINEEKLAIVNTGSDSITIVGLNKLLKSDCFFLSQGKPYLGPHQIIPSHKGGVFYLTNSYNNSVYKLNLMDKVIEDALIVGCYPSHIDILDNYLLVTNSDSNSISVIDIKTFSLIENIPVGEKPHDIKVDKRTKMIYVTNSNNNTIHVLDIHNNTIDTIKLAYKPLHLYLGKGKGYVVCPLNNGMSSSKIVLFNLEDNTILDTLDIEGSVMDMAIVEKTSTLYTTNIENGCVYKIDMLRKSEPKKIFIGGMPTNLVYNRGFIYITNVLTDNLYVFDCKCNKVIKSIRTGHEPSGILKF